MRTVGSTLWNWALSTTTTDTDTIDNIALLGLVTQTASLVGTRWTRCAVDDVQLSELYFTHSQQGFNECIAGSSKRRPRSTTFSCPRDGIRSIGFARYRIKGRIYLTSQHRTRRRKRRTSDCFFFWISSTYLRAPIWTTLAWPELLSELTDLD